MVLSWWQRWLRRQPSVSPRRRSAPPLRHPPVLESLEDRTLLSAGALDPTFGHGGIGGGSGFNSSAAAVLVQPDGKVIVAGMSAGIDTSSFVVERYTKTGILDQTFGSGGEASVWFNLGAESFEGATGLALQPNGKIIVVGTAGSIMHDSEFAVARLNANGTLDTSFGDNGTVLTSFGTPSSNFRVDSSASGVALQSDGKIVVVGSAMFTWEKGPPPPGFTLYTDFAVARYDTNGKLDQGFGNGGEVLTSFSPLVPGHPPDQASGVVIQKDGKIVVVGTAQGFSEVPAQGGMSLNLQIETSQIALARYNTNGSLDSSFGTNGMVLTSVPNATDSTTAGIALTGSGEIVVAGTARGRFALAEYTTSGKLDPTFGAGGTVTTAILGTQSSSAAGLVITPGGKIVVAGTASLTGNRSDFALVRYSASGTLDSQFGKNGTVLTAVGTNASANAIALQSDGKMVVAGSGGGKGVFLGGRGVAVARYLGDPSTQADAGPGIRGVVMLGPILPVSRYGIPNERPLPGAIISIESAGGGTEITRVVADQQGRFEIHLQPGTYLLVPLPPEGAVWFPRGVPQTVVVGPGPGWTQVTVDYFSGIV
jgi:uncharacterized delta-60 repeat protein